MLKNYVEDLVDLWLGRILAENPEKYAALCRCPVCMAEIKVAALNLMKPFYVTGKYGEVFGEYQQKESQYKMDLMVAITKAIETVDARAHKENRRQEEPALQSLTSLHKRRIRLDQTPME